MLRAALTASPLVAGLLLAVLLSRSGPAASPAPLLTPPGTFGHWPRSSTVFGSTQLAVMEWLLNAAPAGNHSFTVIAPQRAANYRYADALGRTHLEKYSRRGYDVGMYLVNRDRGPYLPPARRLSRQDRQRRANLGQSEPAGQRPGEAFWRAFRWHADFRNLTTAQEFSRARRSSPQPRFWLFVAAYEAFLTGRIVHDFTFLFLSDPPLSLERRFFASGACEGPHAYLPPQDGGWLRGESLLLVDDRRSPALAALLSAYDAAATGAPTPFPAPHDAAARACILLSLAPEGAARPPPAPEAAALWRLVRESGGCAALLLQQSYRAAGLGLAAAPMAVPEGASCARAAAGGAVAPVADGAFAAHLKGLRRASLFQIENGGKNEIRTGGRGSAPPAALAWLGPGAGAGAGAAGRLGALVEGSPLAGGGGRWADAAARAVVEGRCAAPACERAAVGGGCALSFVVPAAQKGASTYLWGLVAAHGMVLPPLRGKGFKETGVYLRERRSDEDEAFAVGSFPHIREGEPFVTGDGTVVYALNYEAALRLRAHNPRLKVLFALRDPVERWWSDYRFHWQQIRGKEGRRFGVEAPAAAAEHSACARALRRAGRDPMEEATAIEHFYHRGEAVEALPECRKGRAAFLRRSLYLPQVLWWRKVFGAENVMVVTFEEIVDPARAAGRLREVFDFLGLCVPDEDYMAAIMRRQNRNRNTTPRAKIPKAYRIDRETYETLHAFFAPYNRALEELVGRRFDWGPKPGRFEDDAA